MSGIYLWGKYEVVDTSETFDIKEYGYNLTLAIAYYIAPVSTVISLGYRYQRFIDAIESSNKSTFYGITLTATYSFSI